MIDYQNSREAAIKRVNDKRDFRQHVVVYVLVNALLVIIWAVSGAGYFWPVFPLVGWGIGLAFHAWSVFGERSITEDDIERELRMMHDAER